MSKQYRNAKVEAEALVDGAFRAWVLEPSPPTVDKGPFFADDPAAGGNFSDWAKWLVKNPEHTGWAAVRWLGGQPKLPAPPKDLVRARINLHRLAATIIAPVRFAANSKFGLRYTIDGFGTPFFGDNRQIRVAGAELIDQAGDEIRSIPITTLAAAARFLDTEIDSKTAVEPDSPELGDVEESLDITSLHTDFVGAWFGVAMASLERLRATAIDPGRVQLWPGHFDLATEAGNEENRASYGASLGDPAIDEPYLYAALWYADRANTKGVELNADSFSGAVLRLSDFPTGSDPVEVANGFWSDFHDGLHS